MFEQAITDTKPNAVNRMLWRFAVTLKYIPIDVMKSLDMINHIRYKYSWLEYLLQLPKIRQLL